MAEIAILGAGLRGLYIAYELEKQGHNCSVFESLSHIGGALVSNRHSSGFLTEDGAHTLLINSEKIESLAQFGPARPKHRAFVRLQRFAL